jgi:hypothetical protein
MKLHATDSDASQVANQNNVAKLKLLRLETIRLTQPPWGKKPPDLTQHVCPTLSTAFLVIYPFDFKCKRAEISQQPGCEDCSTRPGSAFTTWLSSSPQGCISSPSNRSFGTSDRKCRCSRNPTPGLHVPESTIHSRIPTFCPHVSPGTSTTVA